MMEWIVLVVRLISPVLWWQPVLMEPLVLLLCRPNKSKKQRAKPGAGKPKPPMKLLCPGQQSSRNEPVAGASCSTEVTTRAAAEMNQILVGLSQSNAIKALCQAAEQSNVSQQHVAEEFDKSKRVGNVTDSGTMVFRRN